jgi:hypothetical protein
LRFTISGVVTEGLDRAFARLAGLAALYWLPWLIGSTAVLMVDVLFEDQLQLGSAPAWARNLVWAPWIAMAYVMLVRLLIFDQPVKRAINLDFSPAMIWAAPIVTVWFLTSVLVRRIPHWVLFSLFSPLQPYRPEDLKFYAVLLGWSAWIADALLAPCFFGLIVLAAGGGRPDLREHMRLLRLHPLRLVVIALLAAAAAEGVRIANVQFRTWAGAELHAPLLYPWRRYIREAVLFRLSQFPLYFMVFVIETCLFAEAYRRLIPWLPHQKKHIASARILAEERKA